MSIKEKFSSAIEYVKALFIEVNDLDQINENELPIDGTGEIEANHESGKVNLSESEENFRKFKEKYDRVGIVGKRIAERDANETAKRIKEAGERTR